MDAEHSQTVNDTLNALWRAGRPLPTRSLLRKMIFEVLSAWHEEHLAAQIKVGYNSRLTTTLGRAILNQKRIELNPRLLSEHPEELAGVLAHELAHVVVDVRHGRVSPHGREFKSLMRQLSLPERATHTLPVDHLRRKSSKYLYLHRCGGCGYHFVARSVRRHYYCTACGPDMKWDIFRVPNSAAGKKLLKRLRGI